MKRGSGRAVAFCTHRFLREVRNRPNRVNMHVHRRLGRVGRFGRERSDSVRICVLQDTRQFAGMRLSLTLLSSVFPTPRGLHPLKGRYRAVIISRDGTVITEIVVKTFRAGDLEDDGTAFVVLAARPGVPAMGLFLRP